MPSVDRRIVLHAGIAAYVCPLCDEVHQFLRIVLICRLARRNCLRLGYSTVLGFVHEVIGNTNREIGVLEHDAGIGLAVETAVVAFFDQCPGLAFFIGLARDEFFDVGMVYL